MMEKKDGLEHTVRAAMRFSAHLKEQVAETQAGVIVEMAQAAARCFEHGGKLLLCGNGGSAADAQHLATELSIRFRKSVQRRALPAIALNADTTALTAGANDLGYDAVFGRLLEAYGAPGDVVLGISTSGNSMSVANALSYARDHGMQTMALLGGDGGCIRPLADLALIVPYADAADRVQECHIAAGHCMIDCIERLMGFCSDSQ
nr:SIS domain-containing protein [Prosthecochloris vibrioformis]